MDIDSTDFGFNGQSFTYAFTVTFSYQESCVNVTDLYTSSEKKTNNIRDLCI
jgi:hypothetical protein